MATRRVFTITAVLLGYSLATSLTSAVSATEIDATLQFDGNEGSISFFDAECGPECTTVELICAAGASFSIVVIDFDNKQLSEWLTTSDAKASLLIDGERFGRTHPAKAALC
jgi:hypothetical protein